MKNEYLLVILKMKTVDFETNTAGASGTTELFQTQVMLCDLWNFEDGIHFKLVLSGRSINGCLDADLIDWVYPIFLNCYPSLVTRKSLLYQHDDAPVHWSRLAKQKLIEFWEI